MLSFSQGLLLFTIILTPVFLLFLAFSDKKITQPATSNRTELILTLAALLLLSIFALFHITEAKEFKVSFAYLSSIPLVLLLMLCALRSAGAGKKLRTLALFSALLFHVIIIYMPPYGMVMHERPPVVGRLVFEGHYDPALDFVHPVYSPFPMADGLSVMFTKVTGLFPLAAFTGFLPALFLLLATDLLLYGLVKKLTKSWVAGVIAILLFAITPPLNFLDHFHKFGGMMLVLITIYSLVNAFRGEGPRWIVLSLITYTAGIFYHPTAGLGMFLVWGILTFGFLMRRLGSRKEWGRFYKSQLFRARWVAWW